MTETTHIPGFTVHNADRLAVPVLLAVPHAGRDYPPGILQALRLPATSLLRLEDRYADLLARQAIAEGVPAIIAHRARAWIDLNRAEADIDVEMVSGADRARYPAPGVKQRGGLGLVPRRLSGEGEIWKRPFPISEIEARIEHFHRPYHAETGRLLRAMRDKFGIAILLDLHSMPPLAESYGRPAAQFVIGDCFGRSAASRFAELLAGQIVAYGYTAALNHPYSGDHILRHHGAVRHNIHALQLEVDRSLYLDSGLREPGSGVGPLSGMIADLVTALADRGDQSEILIAAE